MKRISLFVIGAHVAILLWMALWMPGKTREKKPLQVRTIIEVTATPAPAAPVAPTLRKTPVVKQTAPKKLITPPKKVAKKSPAKKPEIKPTKKPVVLDALLHQLQESIAKIEEKGHKEVSKKSQIAPKRIPKLQIDGEYGKDENIFASNLVQRLQNALELPEMGTVKLELTLKCDGTFVQMRVLESASNRNQKFLETQLKALKYPAFSGSLKQEKEHIFVLSFCNH